MHDDARSTACARLIQLHQCLLFVGLVVAAGGISLPTAIRYASIDWVWSIAESSSSREGIRQAVLESTAPGALFASVSICAVGVFVCGLSLRAMTLCRRLQIHVARQAQQAGGDV